ncbi:MAG: hypothetical protein MI976_09490 [Pseudomonadales bacterium]|nr:hypothetical protein [Pseudomonadales bacterium]
MATTAVTHSPQRSSWIAGLVYKVAQSFIDFKCEGGRFPSRLPLKFLQYSADLGHVRAMSGLGCLLYRFGACRAEKRSGMEYIRQAAKCGDPEAQYVLGKTYLTDDHINQKNQQLAIHWLALAADKGHTLASQKLHAVTEQEAQVNKQRANNKTSNERSVTVEEQQDSLEVV